MISDNCFQLLHTSNKQEANSWKPDLHIQARMHSSVPHSLPNGHVHAGRRNCRTGTCGQRSFPASHHSQAGSCHWMNSRGQKNCGSHLFIYLLIKKETRGKKNYWEYWNPLFFTKLFQKNTESSTSAGKWWPLYTAASTFIPPHYCISKNPPKPTEAL